MVELDAVQFFISNLKFELGNKMLYDNSLLGGLPGNPEMVCVEC